MPVSHANLLEALKYPAAIINSQGALVMGSSEGETLYQKLDVTSPMMLEQLTLGQPFNFLLEEGLMTYITPIDDSGEFLVQWKTVSDAEQRLALFQQASRAVNSSLVLEEIFDTLGEVLRAFIPYDSGTIVILDESQNNIKVIVLLDGKGHAEIRGDNNLFVGYDDTIDGLLKNPVSQHLKSPLPGSVMMTDTSKEALLVPISSKGMIIGGMSLCGTSFSRLQLKLLEEVAEQVAIAIENARLYWQTQSQAGQQFLINQITNSIRQSLDINGILQTTAEEVGQVLGLSRCLIHYWGHQNTTEAPFNSEACEHFEYTMPSVSIITKPSDFVVFERQLFLSRTNPTEQFNPFILNDCRDYPDGQTLFKSEKINSMAIFPILLEDKEFVGTITLHQCHIYRTWVGSDIDLLKAIAEHVSVALHQAKLFEETEKQRKQLENTLHELKTAQMHLIQSEKMAALGQFVAGIAHEVNTPLGTITANQDTVTHCLEKMPTSTPESDTLKKSALELLHMNHMASKRIEDIVKNLRNFARLDESDLKRVDVHDGLESTLLLISKTLLQHKIEIVKNYAKLPMVDCFPGLLNQVFLNLCVNAIHAIDSEGTITITTQHNTDTNQIEVGIADTGKGIPEKDLERIFDPGFTTKGVGVGTGLGLSLCYTIMEKHKGLIRGQQRSGQRHHHDRLFPCQPIVVHPPPDAFC